MKKLVLLFLGLFLHSLLIADYSYDENGNIASIYIPENGEVLYKYDPIQRLIEAPLHTNTILWKGSHT